MRFLRPQDKDVFEKLLVIAHGDAGLVEQALQQSSRARSNVTLSQVISKLKSLTGRKAVNP